MTTPERAIETWQPDGPWTASLAGLNNGHIILTVHHDDAGDDRCAGQGQVVSALYRLIDHCGIEEPTRFGDIRHRGGYASVEVSSAGFNVS